ncbi:hypothetical protein EVC45_03505 [Paraburkholderia sp. UYCP14C]|uniref:hypothetical protein n=1 Tax=Paraburkholderia sp. UYCP14C TaxID=2511130 RepID=UPI0010223F68|nr:hypothetical protein [Paraburkholderia sp. UYCP14C]RZF31031.1 hypothetical protein EVC45_03505 [Paraburkholderia sp. UYCP14C]
MKTVCVRQVRDVFDETRRVRVFFRKKIFMFFCVLNPSGFSKVYVYQRSGRKQALPKAVDN